MKATKKMLTLLCLAVFIMLPGAANAVSHVVEPGETLYTIGQKYGVTYQRIKESNGLKSDSIYPGQRLNIENGLKYTVVPGDSLYNISKKFGVTVNKLMQDNGLKNSYIYPGQVLAIGTGGTAQAQSSPSRSGYAGNSTSRSEFDLLARIISAEADSESYETKVAVGAVILNRTRSGLFPDTIPGVVYQVDNGGKYQFEPVLNGWINQPASQSAMNAARDALNGWDPTNGALYFFESWVPNNFLQSRPLSKVMDSFTFTY
ncbi:spore cortex-lytic enzyme SleB [Desulfocucumis palustris]|uniref:Spore cortex-lytic enzyme SleB n=1 Tax=Desulfocucumis palustris TaxID=1898651 RepID=A0A2L2XD63_9FIRM|nr:LysM peptidoglycan-binding domain-containing protein [Desulfocucumis palustris]GBF34072.1 spore cortex-lytic enzyme SleB [Desulfocucumis palustris]